MRKTKIAITLLIGSLFGLLWLAPAYAAPIVSIVQLPEYVRVDNFKLSCTALGGSTAQFSYKKDGEAYANLGSAIDLTSAPCLVDVTSSQINEQKKFFFKVNVDGTEVETSTTYDVTAPSAIHDYGKERIGPTTYKIRWTNPGEGDFAQVFIYRGEAKDFGADSDKIVAQVGGAPDAQMSWLDNSVSADKEYYYIIRALDKAGNSSSLVGEAGTVLGAATATTPGATGQTGTVSVLPKEEPKGEVLKESTEATPTAAPQTAKEAVGQAVETIKTSKALSTIAIAAFIVGLFWYFLSRRRSNNG